MPAKKKRNCRHGSEVHLGETSFRHEAGVEVMPFARFLAELETGL